MYYIYIYIWENKIDLGCIKEAWEILCDIISYERYYYIFFSATWHMIDYTSSEENALYKILFEYERFFWKNEVATRQLK